MDTKHRADLPVLCGCFPLAIYFTFGSLYMSMPLSHFISAYPSPSLCPQVHSLCLCLRQSSHRRGSSRSRQRGVRDWIAPWVWAQKDQDNWWLQGTLFRIYWILYRQKRNSLLDNGPIELLIVSVHSPPWTSTCLQRLSLNIIFP